MAVLPERIVFERLFSENSSSTYEIFEREPSGDITFDRKYFRKGHIETLEIIAKAIRERQLFLTKCIEHNIHEFLPLYDWVGNQLRIIGPTGECTVVHHFGDPDDEINLELLNLLHRAGAGIDCFVTRKIYLPSAPAFYTSKLKSELIATGGKLRANDLIVSLDGDDPVFEKLKCVHQNKFGDSVIFDLKDESDGVRRLLDLAPVLVELVKKQDMVVVIDDLDCNLHSNTLEHLLKYYLESCNNDSRSQLIFTTHDVTILSQNIFRRDELWDIEKAADGSSRLFSFGEFKGIRSDRDIRKLYLDGGFGAVPPAN